MTTDEQDRQLERRRFIDNVVARAAERAGIENTPEERRRYVDRVIESVAAEQRARGDR